MNSNEPPEFSHSSFQGEIGLSRRDITPPVGIYSRNWGAAEHDAAEGIHRPLFVTALAIAAENEKPLVIIDADLGWWRNLELERKFRDQVLEALDLDESRFIFALTHTHSAPPLTDQAEADWKGGELLAPYLDQVLETTIETVRDALKSLQPAVLEWRSGKCQLATARDLQDPNEDRIVCGFDPNSNADDTLLVGRIADAAGKTIGVITNYACHPTTLAWDNKLISPDFIGAMRETIEKENEAALAIFLQGASGELSPRYQYVGDPTVPDSHGRELGYAVLSILAGMEPSGQKLSYQGVCESGAPLAVWKREAREHSTELIAIQTEIDLPIKDWPFADQLEQQKLAATDRQTEERLRRKRDIRRSLGDGDRFPLPVWIWKIGDAILVANMCESYSWIQQQLREKFTDTEVIYLNLANGSIGYLPTAEKYNEDIYQVWQTPFATGSLETLESGISDQIKDL